MLDNIFKINSNIMFRHMLVLLWRNTDAATVIEYALVAPTFLALLLAALNTALIYIAQADLETTAEAASRLIMTGEAQTLTASNGDVGMSAADFKNAICQGIAGTDSNGNSVNYPRILPPMLSCSQLIVNVKTAAAYNTTSMAAPTFTYNQNGVLTSTGTGYSDQTNGSGQNQIVVLQLIYLWPVSTGPLGFNFSDQPNSKKKLVATSVFTTEAYACGATQSNC